MSNSQIGDFLFYQADVGKRIRSTKIHYVWEFKIDGTHHKVELFDSKISKKRKLIADGVMKYTTKNEKVFSHHFKIGNNAISVLTIGETFELRINNKSFNHLMDFEKNKLLFFGNEKPVSNVSQTNPTFKKLYDKTVNYGTGIINTVDQERDKPSLFNFAIKPNVPSRHQHNFSLTQKINFPKDFILQSPKNYEKIETGEIFNLENKNHKYAEQPIEDFFRINEVVNDKETKNGNLTRFSNTYQTDNSKNVTPSEISNCNNYFDLMKFDTLKASQNNRNINNIIPNRNGNVKQEMLKKDSSESPSLSSLDPLSIIESIKNEGIKKRDSEFSKNIHQFDFTANTGMGNYNTCDINYNSNGILDNQNANIIINNNSPPLPNQNSQYYNYMNMGRYNQLPYSLETAKFQNMNMNENLTFNPAAYQNFNQMRNNNPNLMYVNMMNIPSINNSYYQSAYNEYFSNPKNKNYTNQRNSLNNNNYN